MILKTGVITKEDLEWCPRWRYGLALVAPYLMLEVLTHEVLTGQVRSPRLFWLATPLGAQNPHTECFAYRRLLGPKALNQDHTADPVSWKLINRLVKYARAINPNRNPIKRDS